MITSPARKVAPSVGESIVALGTLPTLIVSGVEIELFTPSDTVSRTKYWPGFVYVCAGLLAVDEVPSPKSHEYVIG